ncbi:MAG: flippase-like domain-containing protein [Anaerolineae bacterium]|nr:flippase-like domain-containing protein [Anaerolineae bacterium]
MQTQWIRIVKGVILVVALGFLGALVRSQWSALQTYEWRLAPGWAVAALVGLALTWFFEAATWRMILTSIGGVLPSHQAYLIWFLSNIVRYIPGNIWQFLGMAELAHDEGVPRIITLTSIVLHQVISTVVGIVLAACYFALFDSGDWLRYLRPALLVAPLGLLLLQPRLLEGVLNCLLRRLGRPAIRVSLTGRQIVILIGRYLVVWLMMGLSFAALVRGLTPLDGSATAYLVASWAAAYVIGYLTLLTPAGLGVREGALALLLMPVVPAGVAAVIAIVARLWMVAGEVVGAAAALAVRGRR